MITANDHCKLFLDKADLNQVINDKMFCLCVLAGKTHFGCCYGVAKKVVESRLCHGHIERILTLLYWPTITHSYTGCIKKYNPNLMLYNLDKTTFHSFILGSSFSLIFYLLNEGSLVYFRQITTLAEEIYRK